MRIASIRTRNPLNQILQDLGYSFDPVGNLTTLIDRANSAGQSFQYDPLNRLTSAAGAYGAYAYRYDQLGNLLSKDNGISMSYGQPDRSKPHAVTQCAIPGADPAALSYDPNGNLTARPAPSVSPTPQPATGSITVTLQPGWNCLGAPFDWANSSIPSALGGLALGTDYDQVSIPARSASFAGDPAIDQISTIPFGNGFWLFVKKPGPIQCGSSYHHR